MNRYFARVFAGLLPILHLTVLGLLGVAAFTDILDLPGTGAREVALGLSLMAGYLLFAGLASVIVAMWQATERMASALEARGATPRQPVAEPKTPGGRREPSLSVGRAEGAQAAARKEPVLVGLGKRADA